MFENTNLVKNPSQRPSPSYPREYDLFTELSLLQWPMYGIQEFKESRTAGIGRKLTIRSDDRIPGLPTLALSTTAHGIADLIS